MSDHIVYRYTDDKKNIWDRFIDEAKNGTFLFKRDYMEYHKDRYLDCSFIFEKKGQVDALLAGTVQGDTFYTHKGLTYGGWLISRECKILDLITAFDLLHDELRKIGIKTVVYKPIPEIYHSIPAQEDLYILFLLKGILVQRVISSTISQQNKIVFNHSRKDGVRKSIKYKVHISESVDFKGFWEILNGTLSHYHNAKPVHSVSELEYLSSLFTDNIKLYAAFNPENIMIAGTVIYINRKVVHVQYISANEEGKNLCALDLLFHYLINEVYLEYDFFDFGSSCENQGRILNTGLIYQKEGFGGRGVVYDVYEYSVPDTKISFE